MSGFFFGMSDGLRKEIESVIREQNQLRRKHQLKFVRVESTEPTWVSGFTAERSGTGNYMVHYSDAFGEYVTPYGHDPVRLLKGGETDSKTYFSWEPVKRMYPADGYNEFWINKLRNEVTALKDQVTKLQVSKKPKGRKS